MTKDELIQSLAQTVRLHKAGIIDTSFMVLFMIHYESVYLSKKTVM